MNKNEVKGGLSVRDRELLDRCIAWHIRPHREAIIDGLASISPEFDFESIRVLELSATGRSMVSPFLVARGARVTVTCYLESELDSLANTVSLFSREYGLSEQMFTIRQADVFKLDNEEKYDLIVIKDAFGGYNREHNGDEFRKAMACISRLVSRDGRVLVVDKGHNVFLLHWVLTRWGQAGRNGWHYFSFEELKEVGSNDLVLRDYSSYGVLSFADMGGGILQFVADFMDKYVLEHLISNKKRAVFSACFQKCASQVHSGATGTSSLGTHP